MHYVDEDLTAVAVYGGFWGDDLLAGITHWYISNSPTNAGDIVASKNNHTLSLQRKSV